MIQKYFCLLTDVTQFLIDRALKTSQHKLKPIDSSNPPTVAHSQPEQNATQPYKLVCYYSSPASLNYSHELYPKQIDPFLCTHINIGIISIDNSRIVIDQTTIALIEQMNQLKRNNTNLKILMWIGGPSDSAAFLVMIANQANRMTFIRSVEQALHTHQLDGIDLDWEFPLTYDNQKKHFAQLLYEIREAYRRDNQEYLLSVAVAAPEGIAFYAYDIKEMNLYCDYVNVMSYDYHFYAEGSPFTGKLPVKLQLF